MERFQISASGLQQVVVNQGIIFLFQSLGKKPHNSVSEIVEKLQKVTRIK